MSLIMSECLIIKGVSINQFSREKCVSTSAILRTLPSHQFRDMFPKLSFFALGDEIHFTGPEDQIAEAFSFFSEYEF